MHHWFQANLPLHKNPHKTVCNVYLVSLWYILNGHISSSITVKAMPVSPSEYFHALLDLL